VNMLCQPDGDPNLDIAHMDELRMLATQSLAAACLYHTPAVAHLLDHLQKALVLEDADLKFAVYAAFALGETGSRAAAPELLKDVVLMFTKTLERVLDRPDVSYGADAAYYASEALGICTARLAASGDWIRIAQSAVKALARTLSISSSDPKMAKRMGMPRFAAGLALVKLAPVLLGADNAEAVSTIKLLIEAAKETEAGRLNAQHASSGSASSHNRYASYYALVALTRSTHPVAQQAAISFLMERRWCSATQFGRPY